MSDGQIQLLFDDDPADDSALTIQERFERFHARNPWVYAQLVAMAREFRARRPHRRVGIGMLFEVLRWEYYRQTEGDDFKLNNNWRSRYARLIMDSEADLADAFETRALQTA